MDIQALGQMLMQRKRGDITEEEKAKRRLELETQKTLQNREQKRLMTLLQGTFGERTQADTESFLQTFGNLLFFKEYIQEANKAPVRTAFQKGELRSFYKGEFVTRKGDKNNSFKVILEGQVGLYLEMADPRAANKKQLILIRKMLPGDPIEIGTLIDNQTYVMTTKALTDRVEVLCLSPQNFSLSFQKYESEKYEADLNFLRGVPIFSDWPKRNLISLQMCISKFTVPRSQIIYQEGQPSHAIFIVKSGEFGQYKKRAMWQKSENLKGNDRENEDNIAEKLSRLDDAKLDLKGKPISSELIPSEQEIPSNPNTQTLLRGLSRANVAKKITGFMAGSVIEMNSDLIATFSVFESFGEKELLNQQPRYHSIVCKSQQGELIQVKSRHFFILAQENPELKYAVMTKMMIDSKKQEISNMRYNLTFRNENEMQILDNHLEGISSASPSSAISTATATTHFSHASQSMNDMYATQHVSTLDHNRTAQPASPSQRFQINKLQFTPTQNQKLSAAQIYFQQRQVDKHTKAQTPLSRLSVSHQHLPQPQSVTRDFKRKSSIINLEYNAYMTEKEARDASIIDNNSQLSQKTSAGNSSIVNLGTSQRFSIIASAATTTTASQNGLNNNRGSPNSSDRLNNNEILPDSSSVVKLPPITGSLTAMKESPLLQPIPHLRHLPQSQSMTSLSHSVAISFNNNNNGKTITTRRSFNLGNSLNSNEETTPNNRYNRAAQHMINGLPSQTFSSRPLINSITYSNYQLNI